MALEVQNGKAVLWGIPNNGSAITILGYAGFLLKDGKLDHKFKLTAVEDEAGNDAALVGSNEFVETTITWIPANTTRAAVYDDVTIPTPLKKITMSNFSVDILNGDWIYVGDATINLSQGASGSMSLKVRKYIDSTQNASLTTTAS